MPVEYTKSGGQGHKYQVPDYPEAADGPKSFKDFADFLDLILPPVGTIMPYVGSSAPTGWLLCSHAGTNEGAYSSATYPKLSALCGDRFGTAPAGMFKVPDLRGRTIAGLDTQQTEFDTIGKASGAKTVTITTSNMPSHNHSASTLSLGSLVAQNGGTASTGGDHQHGPGTFALSDGQHGHTTRLNSTVVTSVTSTENTNTAGGGSLTRVSSVTGSTSFVDGYTTTALGPDGDHSHSFSGLTASTGGHTHTISGSISGNVANSGSGTAMNVQNPYMTMNHIIRAA